MFRAHKSCIAALFVFVLVCLHSCDAAYNVLGFKTRNAAYLSASSAIAHNGVTIGDDFHWIRKVGGMLICIQGDVADCEELFSILDAQNRAHELDFDGRMLSCKSAAHFCQSVVSQRLRTNRRLNVEIMIAGVSSASDPDASPQLYWLDSIGSLQSVEYAAHGPDTPFLLSMLDQNKSKMRAEQVASSVGTESQSTAGGASSDDCARSIADQCWSQLSKRSRGRIDQNSVTLQCVDRAGCRDVPMRWHAT